MTMPSYPPGLPPILEIKHTLDSRQKQFDCRLLVRAADGRHAAVLWIASAPMHVHGVDLPAGTVSVGHFWTDRHYNVYHWLEPAGKTLGYYFNICDQTRIEAGVIEWRDLIVDVLALPGGRLELLDEDELPAELPPEAAAHIADGKAALLTDPAAVLSGRQTASRAVLPHSLVYSLRYRAADRP